MVKKGFKRAKKKAKNYLKYWWIKRDMKILKFD